MPEHRVPVEIVLNDSDLESSGDALSTYKEDQRSISPKSCTSSSEISDTLSVEFSDSVSDGGSELPQSDINLIDDLYNLKLMAEEEKADSGVMSEEEADELIRREGADLRHVMLRSWKLDAKLGSGRSASKASSLLKIVPGQSLRDLADAQRLSIEQHERKQKVRPPPGFDTEFGVSTAAGGTALNEPAPILVSYTDGKNTLSMSAEPLCLHNITVSAAVDSCHVFIKQMDNPTHEGLAPLEQAMLEAFQAEEAAPHAPLLRPIAAGSLLAVCTDEKWYRCQVVDYNSEQDTCDVKFVDHGGYTTVAVSQLRTLKTDFIRLPFQAIEVYIAHVSPATDEIVIDIASDILFRDNVSVQLLGLAEDGIPVVQAYFYKDEYINLFTQEILDDCYRVLLDHHPDYVPVPTPAAATFLQEEPITSPIPSTSPSPDCSCASPDQFPTLLESMAQTSSSDWSAETDNSSSNSSTIDEASPSPVPQSLDEQPTIFAPEEQQQQVVYAPVDYGQQGVAWVPVNQPMIAYYVPDPTTGVLYCVTTPLVAAPVYQQQQLELAEESCTVEEEEESSLGPECKPFEEWTQEDYERYYYSHEC